MRAAILAVMALCLAPAAYGDGEPAGEFDYYLLALSWSPGWCRLEGDERGATECRDGAGLGFTLHGLWPQFEQGWPSFCRTSKRDPTRSQTASMADIMGSGGLAWYQWKKHGRCSGLTAQNYYRLARLAFERITRPKVLRDLPRSLRIAPEVVEAAFLEANPGLSAENVTISCKEGLLYEVRICLDRRANPRSCSVEVARDCPLRAIEVDPPR